MQCFLLLLAAHGALNLNPYTYSDGIGKLRKETWIHDYLVERKETKESGFLCDSLEGPTCFSQNRTGTQLADGVFSRRIMPESSYMYEISSFNLEEEGLRPYFQPDNYFKQTQTQAICTDLIFETLFTAQEGLHYAQKDWFPLTTTGLFRTTQGRINGKLQNHSALEILSPVVTIKFPKEVGLMNINIANSCTADEIEWGPIVLIGRNKNTEVFREVVYAWEINEMFVNGVFFHTVTQAQAVTEVWLLGAECIQIKSIRVAHSHRAEKKSQTNLHFSFGKETEGGSLLNALNVGAVTDHLTPMWSVHEIIEHGMKLESRVMETQRLLANTTMDSNVLSLSSELETPDATVDWKPLDNSDASEMMSLLQNYHPDYFRGIDINTITKELGYILKELDTKVKGKRDSGNQKKLSMSEMESIFTRLALPHLTAATFKYSRAKFDGKDTTVYDSVYEKILKTIADQMSELVDSKKGSSLLSSKLTSDFKALLENMKSGGKAAGMMSIDNKDTIEALTEALKGSGAKIKTISLEDLGLTADSLGEIENIVQKEVEAALGDDGDATKLDLSQISATLKEKLKGKLSKAKTLMSLSTEDDEIAKELGLDEETDGDEAEKSTDEDEENEGDVTVKEKKKPKVKTTMEAYTIINGKAVKLDTENLGALLEGLNNAPDGNMGGADGARSLLEMLKNGVASLDVNMEAIGLGDETGLTGDEETAGVDQTGPPADAEPTDANQNDVPQVPQANEPVPNTVQRNEEEDDKNFWNEEKDEQEEEEEGEPDQTRRGMAAKILSGKLRQQIEKILKGHLGVDTDSPVVVTYLTMLESLFGSFANEVFNPEVELTNAPMDELQEEMWYIIRILNVFAKKIMKVKAGEPKRKDFRIAYAQAMKIMEMLGMDLKMDENKHHFLEVTQKLKSMLSSFGIYLSEGEIEMDRIDAATEELARKGSGGVRARG